MNHDQFTEYYYKYKNLAYAHALRKLGDQELVQDVVQEAFTRVWSAVREKPQQKYTHSYILRILNNLIIDTYRKRKFVGPRIGVAHNNPDFDGRDFDIEAEGADNFANGNDWEKFLTEIWPTLKPIEQQIVASLYRGYSVSQTARRMGKLDPNATHVVVSRMKKRLKETVNV